MPIKRRRSPAEKKALSYAKDRRNCYGENDKASRKAIPRSKAKGHRADRRKAAGALKQHEVMDEDQAALVENELVNDLGRHKRWTKEPDRSLGEYVDRQKAKRQNRIGRKKWVQENIKLAQEQGARGFSHSWRGSEEDSTFKTV